MIILFGDSWARQSWRHSSENISNGYKHWSLPETWVVNTHDWLNSYFNQRLAINFARFGNTTDWILRDLWHAWNTMTNFPDRVDFVVFQTDPLRIFAPRQDYNDRNIVWPNFTAWCDRKRFDWQTRDMEDLLTVIYQDWYRELDSFQHMVSQANPEKQIYLWLLGGVSRLHSSVSPCKQNIITDSVTGLFGFDQDCCLENRASFTSLIHFWGDGVSDSDHRYLLHQQWQHYDNMLLAKEKFWVQHPRYFAGRHLTSEAMSELAGHIEQSMNVI